jgi:hypothetical protein
MTCAFQRPHGKVQAPRTYARRVYGRTAHKDGNSTIEGFLRLLKSYYVSLFVLFMKKKRKKQVIMNSGVESSGAEAIY